MTAFLKILVLCLLLLTLTSCHYVARLRGPCSIWPMPEPEGSRAVTQTFSSNEGRFRIGLPDRSEPAAEGNTKTFKWLIINVGAYQVFFVDREVAVDTPEVSEALFKRFRESASSHGKLTDSEISISGHPGREFRTEDDGGTRIERIYLAGNRIYVVSVFVPKSMDCKIGSAAKVLDTFEIID